MSELQNIQGELATVRNLRNAAQNELLSLKAQLERKQLALRNLERYRNPQDQGYLALKAQLEQEISSVQGAIVKQRSDILQLKGGSRGLIGSLLQLGDPTQQIEEFTADVPFLLFPLRVETRFKLKANETRDTDELWMRFYPDDCQVNSFEGLLRENEVTTGKAFWGQYWAAAGNETKQRSAWKALAASHGSGRAAWIIQILLPTNPVDAPDAGGDGTKVFLVLNSEAGLTAAQESAAMTFWAAYWKADGDKTQENAAYATLEAAVGATVAETVLKKFIPVNILDEPATGERAGATVTAVRQYFPSDDTLTTLTKPWNQAPKAALMPDRIVVTMYNGSSSRTVMTGAIPDDLAVGPDPSLSEAEQLQVVDGGLQVNDDLKWMTDFEAALGVGMGLRIQLSAAEAVNGFEKITVVGLRLSADAATTQADLEQLLEDHYHSRHGMSFVPQGSATNNTEDEGSAYTWTDDQDFAFDIVFGKAESNVPAAQASAKRDGEWFADYLGLNEARIARFPHSNGRDQAEAQAMNRALWPATLGYFMEELTGDLFTDDDREFVREYFIDRVSGRGPIPAVRIGKQPYGVLPITTFKSLQFSGSIKPTNNLLSIPQQRKRLYDFLIKLNTWWETMGKDVAHVGKSGDPHQVLLDVLGLHHGSVEYHQRYSETMMHLYNTLKLQGSDFVAALLVGLIAAATQQMGSDLGIPADKLAMKILEIYHRTTQDRLVGDIVDSQELSETEEVEEYAAGLNYLDWLANSSLDIIRKMEFGNGVAAPTSLLFLFLRHAMLMGHYDAGVKVLTKANAVDAKVARTPADFIHVETGKSLENSVSGKSKWELLYQKAPASTGRPDLTVADYLKLPDVLQNIAEAAALADIKEAVAFLAHTPTARLERLFAEHIDTVSYRLDAWKTGMVAEKILQRRARQHQQGIQVGCYAFLEKVKPEAKTLTPKRLTPQQTEDFGKLGPIVTDSKNGGYIHAPSLTHAATAAILKNAYEENASSSNADLMAVNISSERVRNALTVLEGIRNGQTLGALLGYRFERGLHDAHNLAEVDKFIYPLRKQFPLVADKLSPTQSGSTTPARLIAARNVLDGSRLVAHVREKGIATYPFGLPTGSGEAELPAANAAEAAAINKEVQKLLDLNDAVADLVMSENVYQVVRGNFEKAASISQAFSEGKYPHEPEVVQTPRSGIGITQRMAIHLEPGAASPNAFPLTPRAIAEPALHAWLCGLMPAPDQIAVTVTYDSPALAGPQATDVTLAQMGFQPMDLLYIFNQDMEQAMTALDDRILQFLRYDASVDPHPAIKAEIQYSTLIPGKVTLFELASLIRSLQKLVLRSRHLGVQDLVLSQTATSSDVSYDLTQLGNRVETARIALDGLLAQLIALQTDASDIDQYALLTSTAFLQVAAYGVPGAGTANLHEGIRTIHAALMTKVDELVARWQEKAVAYTTLMAGYAALTTDEERFALLREIEGTILSTTTPELPATPALYLADIEANKILFDNALTAFQGQQATTATTLTAFVAALQGMIATAAIYDAVPLSLEDALGDGTPEKVGTIATHRATILTQINALVEDLTARLQSTTDLLTAAAAATETETALRTILEAAKKVLGDDIKLLPVFTFTASQMVEVGNAHGDTASLLNYLKTTKGRRFPVDDWFYGLARVREKASELENTMMLSEALGGAMAELKPLQFPFVPGDHWLGLEIPETYEHLSEHLLYTAQFPAAWSAGNPQCGLLLDEWNEVIPAKEETTGIAFHYDQPSQEPGQAWLLVTPASLNETWTWAELLNGVNSALEEAKLRAVEPDQIDKTPLGQFLPATLMAVTLYQITIATNLLQNNQVYTLINS
jgi:hypothetical protein